MDTSSCRTVTDIPGTTDASFGELFHLTTEPTYASLIWKFS
jgi:hypothetical protein